MAILHLDVPAQQQGILDALQMRLRALPGMYEVAVGRCTGSYVRASLKATAQALNEAQKRLGRTLGLGVRFAGYAACAEPGHDATDIDVTATAAEAAPRDAVREQVARAMAAFLESDQAAAANAGSAPRYRSAVHVLLSPGRVYSTAPPPNQGECGTVFVMGLHNSGTHALIEYLSKYFSVAVHPRMKQKHKGKSNAGLLLFKTWQLWKHHVPLQTLALPTGAATGPATLLLTVRNITSWLASMSRSPYELYPHPTRHRQRHSPDVAAQRCCAAHGGCRVRPESRTASLRQRC